MQALGCRDFDEYQSIHAAWDAIAEQRVPVHLEGDQTKRWLKRNTTHFVQIVIPRMPNANVFRLTNLTDAK